MTTTSATAGRRPTSARRPRNPQGVIEIELAIHDRALATYASASLDYASQIVFAYGVISSAITDPDLAYTSDQLAAVLRGLDRSRRTYVTEGIQRAASADL